MYNPITDMYKSIKDSYASGSSSSVRNAFLTLTLLATFFYAGCQNAQSTRGSNGKITSQAQQILQADAETLQGLVESGALPKESMQGAHIGGWTF